MTSLYCKSMTSSKMFFWCLVCNANSRKLCKKVCNKLVKIIYTKFSSRILKKIFWRCMRCVNYYVYWTKKSTCCCTKIVINIINIALHYWGEITVTQNCPLFNDITLKDWGNIAVKDWNNIVQSILPLYLDNVEYKHYRNIAAILFQSSIKIIPYTFNSASVLRCNIALILDGNIVSILYGNICSILQLNVDGILSLNDYYPHSSM